MYPLDPLEELARLPRNVATMPRRIELCRQVLAEVRREEEPELWARLQWALGVCLAGTTEGDHVQNLEQAIKHYQAALEVYTNCETPTFATRVGVPGFDLIHPIHDGTDIYDISVVSGSPLPHPKIESDGH